MTGKRVPLIDLLETSIGGVWGKQAGEDEIDVRVWRVTELKPGGILDPASAASRSVTVKQYESRALRPGDLLLEKSGGGPRTPVGRVGLVRSVPEPAICSNFMQLLRARNERVDPRYLHLYLNYFHSSGGTLDLQTASTNIRNIKAGDYVAIPIPLPPLEEQRRIVDLLEDHLSRLDAAEQSIRRSFSRLAALRDAALSEAVELAFASRGVDVRAIGDLAKVSSGLTPLKGNKAFYEGGTIPWITSGDLYQGLITKAKHFVTQAALDETSLKLVPAGSILIAMYGEGKTRGTAAELGIHATTNQACAAVMLHDPDLRPWVRLVLDANYSKLAASLLEECSRTSTCRWSRRSISRSRLTDFAPNSCLVVRSWTTGSDVSRRSSKRRGGAERGSVGRSWQRPFRAASPAHRTRRRRQS